MEKIFENWRQYEKEVLSEVAGFRRFQDLLGMRKAQKLEPRKMDAIKIALEHGMEEHIPKDVLDAYYAQGGTKPPEGHPSRQEFERKKAEDAAAPDDPRRPREEIEDPLDGRARFPPPRGGDGRAKVAGIPVTLNKAGEPLGIWRDHDGRIVVSVGDVGSEEHALFMYSSGTSYQTMLPDGTLVNSPRVWFPVGAWMNNKYMKIGPKNPKFGTGNEEVWDTLGRITSGNSQHDVNRRIHPDTHIRRPSDGQWVPGPWMDQLYGKDTYIINWDEKLTYYFGKMWPQKLASAPKDGALHKMVKEAIDDGAWLPTKDEHTKIGKYPSPNSEFGRISNEILKLSPDGTVTDELLETFGPVMSPTRTSHDGAGGDYNMWAIGHIQSQPQINESQLVFEKWRKIIT
jgi:hypothetical protein